MKRHVVIAGFAAILSGSTGVALGATEIPHVSGGIGVAEQQQLDARRSEFNLKLVFTLNEGNYVAGVDVAVKDANGATVVQDVADGPFFMARLPAGQYSIAATYEGKTVARKIRVASKGLRTEYLRWPSNPQTDDVELSRSPEKTAQNSK